MRSARRILGWLAVGLVVVASPSIDAKEPANLDPLKREIRAYLDSGEYERDIAAVAREANAWVEERAKQGGTKLLVVFDLDETLFSNLPLIRAQDFGYNAQTWIAWVAEGRAPAFGSVVEVYRTARKLGVGVIFLTGRRERDRPGTEKNLRSIGCVDYQALIMKPDATKEASGAFKRAERCRLESEGFVIIANIGDQMSDLEGGAAERTFKLPNPLYLSN